MTYVIGRLLKRIMRIRLVLIGLLVLIAIATILLNNPFRLNLAHLQLNRLIWSSSDNTEAYRALLYDTGKRFTQISSPDEDSLAKSYGECSSLIAWLMAIQSRYRRDFEQTGAWLLRVAENFPDPQVNLPVMFPAHIVLEPETGDAELTWDTGYWKRRLDSQPFFVQTELESQVLTLSYENTPLVRDKVIYAWRGSLDLSYWHELQVVARVSRGTYLTLEVETENGLNRYFSYHRGTGDWETFVLPLEGTNLRHIYISLREPANAVESTKYKVELRPVTIRLKPDLRTCKPV